MHLNVTCFFLYASPLSNGVEISIFNQQMLTDSYFFLDLFDPARRYLSFDLHFQNLIYRIANLYAPALPSVSSASFSGLEILFLCTHSCVDAGISIV